MEGQGKVYCDFIAQYQNYPQELFKLVSAQRSFLATTTEDENYNLGTMQRDVEPSSNIAVVNALSFNRAFNNYKLSYPDMPETEIKARIVFDFLQQHGVDFSYEKNKNDILFNDGKGNNITREQFYTGIYMNAMTNTNFFDKNVGNMQILSLEPKSVTDTPRNTAGLSQERINQFMNIPDAQRLEILYKRGLYHESIHMAMGTTDERKCDAFALLKIMKEHPDNAKVIFDIYNIQRSKMGYTVETLHGQNDESKSKAIRSGVMTYLMPNTYKKLEQYAINPQSIPKSDAEILKLACQLTSEPEFSKAQLSAYAELMKKENIMPQDLANNEIVQSCMQQGGFNNIEKYIASDKKLKKIVDKSLVANKLQGAKTNLKQIKGQENDNKGQSKSISPITLDITATKQLLQNEK